MPESFLSAEIRENFGGRRGRASSGVLTAPHLRYTGNVHLGAVRVGVASYAAAFLVSTSASSQPLSEGLDVGGSGVCPPPDAVRAAIFQLTSAERRRALPPQSRVVVSDEGATYRVSVTGEGTTAQKTYTDPGRDCARRTRFAAVFAILTLMPPELEEEPERTPTEPSPQSSSQLGAGSASEPAPSRGSTTNGASEPNRASVTPSGDEAPRGEADDSGASATPSAPRLRPLVRVELVGFGEQALGAGGEPSVRSLGGELRAVLAQSEIAPLVTLAYAPASRLDAGALEVEVRRVQASVGARVHADLGPLEFGGELAALGAFERISGIGLEHPARGNAFELGIRAGALMSLATNRVGPVIAFHASVFPSPNTFEALPRGEVGHMPHLWLGLSAGLFLGL